MVKIVAIQGFDSKLCTSIATGLNLPQLVTYTTRKAYNDEVDGSDYHFVSKTEFNTRFMKGYFSEVTNINGDMYGIPSSVEKLDQPYCITVDYSGANYLRSLYQDECLVLGISLTWDYMVKWFRDNDLQGVTLFEHKREHLKRLEDLNYCDIVLNVSDKNSIQISKIVKRISKLLL